MTTIVYIVLVLMCLCNIGIIAWFVIKSKQSDEAYEKAIKEIYRRK